MKLPSRFKTIIALAASAFILPTLSADVLVKYDFSDITAPNMPSEVASGLSSESLIFSGAFAQGYEAYQKNPTNEFLFGGDLRIISSKMPKGIKTNDKDYVEVKLKSVEGKTINVTGVELTGMRSDDLPALYVYPKFTTSADGHTAPRGMGQIKSRSATALKGKVDVNSTDGELTIRFYFPCINSGSKNRVVIEDITILGTVK